MIVVGSPNSKIHRFRFAKEFLSLPIQTKKALRVLILTVTEKS
jgi:hypothetical protein